MNPVRMRCLVLSLCLVVLALLGLLAGAAVGDWSMSWGELADAILSGPSSELGGSYVVWNLRLPRTLCAFLAGASLSCAGVLFQGVLRNQLAEPYTLGVASGGAFGAAMSIALGLGASGGAMVGAVGSLGLVMLLGRGGSASEMIMAGVVVSSLLSSGLALIKALVGEKVSAIVIWLMGSFSGAGWSSTAICLLGASASLAAVLLLSKELDIFASGADPTSLGVNERAVRTVALSAASNCAALVVGQFGIIGFLGLVSPHGARLILGPANLPVGIVSFLGGGVLLMWSDLICRLLGELPVGVLTSLMGGPVFILLVWRGSRAAGP